jgi:hypothetical protein
MQIEWEGSLRLWAQRKGLAEFEHWLAENGEQEGISVDWQQLQVGSTKHSCGAPGGGGD